MTITSRIINKFNVFRGNAIHYVFERLGFPKVKGEKISKSVLRKYLPDNPVVLDCGAHEGVDSVLLASMFRATVYAVEPVPEIYKRLLKRVGGHSTIFPRRFALGGNQGIAEFHVSSGASDASGSLLPPKEHLNHHPEVLFEKTISVDVKTIESWAREEDIDHIDMLWLDMQGSELDALRAAGPLLDKVKVIHTEVSMVESYEGVSTYDELRNFLEEQSFKVSIAAIPSGFDMGNVLFVRED